MKIHCNDWMWQYTESAWHIINSDYVLTINFTLSGVCTYQEGHYRLWPREAQTGKLPGPRQANEVKTLVNETPQYSREVGIIIY